MKGLLAHKWVVAVAALVLTLAIGAGAWAVTGTPGMGTGTGDECVGGCSGDCAGCPEAGGAALGPQAGSAGDAGMGRGGRMMQGLGDLEQMREGMQDRFERWQERRGAVLDLVREKMSAEDQAALDALLERVEAQRDAVRKAMEEMRGIHQQIRDLIDEYLPSDEAPAANTGEETTL